ncbi:MAG: FAD-binding and (Fe-S)-binding domain-containing protein [Chloroflexota bacterium]
MKNFSDLLHELNQSGIEAHADPVTRTLYSTDASIYQIEPLGVAFPKTLDHLSAAVELAAKYQIPILARGAGSSLAGQAIGEALILDCSRYLDKIHQIHVGRDGDESFAIVEPGVIMSALNRQAAIQGLQFGPDPASADRATMGGSLANNASGAHSIVYGMFADHLLSVDVILGDGSPTTLEEISFERANQLADRRPQTVVSCLYRTALNIRQNYAAAIRQNWPRTYRRAAGYNLNYLLPWSASKPPQWDGAYPPINPAKINLAPLITGSEGTLAVVTKAKVRLVSKPKHTVLAVRSYESIIAACEAVPELLERNPSAIELIPQVLIRLARAVPAYQRQLAWVQGDPAALLVVEFSGEDQTQLLEKAHTIHAEVIAQTQADQNSIWDVRKVGLGILQSQAGDYRTHNFIEDLTVPVANLGQFVGGMDQIIAEFGTEVYYYAHASAGCLHIHPMVNLKTRQGIQDLRAIAEAAVDLTLSLGGTTTGEHGDGLARSEWLERAYGPEIVRAFRDLKLAADPQGILNPGKIVDPPKMDENLRYGAEYQTQSWQPTLDFSSQGNLAGAIEMCNGAGVCRKFDGVMCPSFQATRDEKHSTRGRGNLLRSLISNKPGRFSETFQVSDKDVKDALDLCLACKGCKSECPSGVDMAKLKYEFLHNYHETHSRKLRDYLFGYIGNLARLGAPFGIIINWGMGIGFVNRIFATMFDLSPNRKLPKFGDKVVGNQVIKRRATQLFNPLVPNTKLPDHPGSCLLLLDPFTQYFYPHDGEAAISVLASAGYDVKILPVSGAGRTLISKGFLTQAKQHAQKVIAAIQKLDPEGKSPIVGVEPSEIYTLIDEYPDFFPGDDRVAAIAKRAWMVDEFLVRRKEFVRNIRASVSRPLSPVLLHGHCYQKARPRADDCQPVGVEATVKLLKIAGYDVEVIDAGCCGMAGAFGYEKEHYEVSMQVGELKLLPAVRNAPDGIIIAASGVSCQAQIEDGTERSAVHPIALVANSLNKYQEENL